VSDAARQTVPDATGAPHSARATHDALPLVNPKGGRRFCNLAQVPGKPTARASLGRGTPIPCDVKPRSGRPIGFSTSCRTRRPTQRHEGRRSRTTSRFSRHSQPRGRHC
jgi:hypothetical protein